MRTYRLSIKSQENEDIAEDEGKHVSANVDQYLLNGVDVNEGDKLLGRALERIGLTVRLKLFFYFISWLIEARTEALVFTPGKDCHTAIWAMQSDAFEWFWNRVVVTSQGDVFDYGEQAFPTTIQSIPAVDGS